MIENIYQRKDGRYEGRITIGYDNGKRQYKDFFDKTVEETIEKMAEFLKK